MTNYLRIVAVLIFAMSLPLAAQDTKSAPASQTPAAAQPAASGVSVQETGEIAGDASEPSEPSQYSPFKKISANVSELAGRSFLSGSVQLSDMYDSVQAENSYNASGSVFVQRLGKNKETALTYTGGGVVHAKRSELDSSFHRFVGSQTFHTDKWSLSLVDQFSYLPESPYGSSAYGGMDTSLIDFLNRMFPDQSFQSQGATRYANAASVYFDRKLDARSSLHLIGAYSFLEFTDTGYVNYRSFSATAGYTREIGRNSLSFDYNGSLDRFTGDTKMQSHALEVTYRHRLSRKFDLEFAAGPDSVFYTDDARNQSQTRVLIDGRASLNWQTRKSSASLSYSHSAGGGGGLLQGADTHSVQVALNRTLRRLWYVGWNAGYSHNSHLSDLTQDISYQSMFTGVTAQRTISRSLAVFLNYNFQYQTAQAAHNPEAIYRRHYVMVGFTYNLRPFAIH